MMMIAAFHADFRSCQIVAARIAAERPFWVISGPSRVLVEKVFPAGQWVGRAAGIALISWGSATLLA
ncbi:hypothetical protein [Mesorhizobium sp.]|uniref:hypothetical protein n=1 Tax=Mesorhizobium sp. TaxID=1871066 RepID=UPI0025DB1640|nr:hypothetical protein [Mesorhizobium sp.]